MNYVKHLIVADAHCDPHQNLRRFDWLGKWIADHDYDWVIVAGDWLTLDSCSFYPMSRFDKTTAAEDLEAGREALRRTKQPTLDKQKRQQRNKKKKIKTKWAFTKGNHEERFDRKIQEDEDVLGSLVSFNSLFGVDTEFDLSCEYRDYLLIDGIQYTHACQNGLRRPMSALNRGRQIALQTRYPTVYGHTHKFDFTTVPILGSTNAVNWSCNCPCFMEQDHVEKYALGSATGWCYGVIELTIFDDGTVVHRWIAMAELENHFNGT